MSQAIRNPDLSAALIHHPVLNKNGEIISSALTNLDLHDIARSCKTYGVEPFYIVTPLADQKILAKTIIDHWIDGYGGKYNPRRKDAVELIKIVDTLEMASDDIRRRRKTAPKIVVTSARKSSGSIGFENFRKLLMTGDPFLLLFGTAWGIADELIHTADYLLEPISGATDYNHLSVRAASAVIFDRLLGLRQ